MLPVLTFSLINKTLSVSKNYSFYSYDNYFNSWHGPIFHFLKNDYLILNYSNILDILLLIFKKHLIYYVHKNPQVSIWSLFRAFSCLLSFTDNFDHNSLQFTQRLLLKLEPQMNTKQTLKISKIKKK